MARLGAEKASENPAKKLDRRTMKTALRTVVLLASLLTTALIALGGCKPAPPPPPTSADLARIEAARVAAEQQRLIDDAQARVRAALKDPESARFRKFSMAEGKLTDGSGRSNRVACGYVNAKNAFGGYVGEQPWWTFELWEGSKTVCINKLEDCSGVVALAAAEEARLCLKSLGD